MAKDVKDMTGRVIKVGDLVMFPNASTTKGSRPDMCFEKVKGFVRGCVQVYDFRYPGSTWDTSVRPTSTPVRIVSKDFKAMWESGELFTKI